jgi:urea transport system permease protein
MNAAPFFVDFFNFFATTSMAKVLVFVLIIAFLQVKPSGIFPQKGRTAEL